MEMYSFMVWDSMHRLVIEDLLYVYKGLSKPGALMHSIIYLIYEYRSCTSMSSYLWPRIEGQVFDPKVSRSIPDTIQIP